MKKKANDNVNRIEPKLKKTDKAVVIEKKAMVKDPFDIIKFVLMTEKSIQLVETQNKLVFIVDRRADKEGIKKAAESAFGSPVQKVQTMVDQKGRKKAFIKFKQAGMAGEIAIRLGII
jgi:large subunit ribosomal protein L23